MGHSNMIFSVFKFSCLLDSTATKISLFVVLHVCLCIRLFLFSHYLYPSDWDHEFCLSRHTLFKEDPCIPSHLLYLLIRRTRTILNGKCSPAVFSEYIPFQTKKPIHKILSHSNKNIRWRPF